MTDSDLEARLRQMKRRPVPEALDARMNTLFRNKKRRHSRRKILWLTAAAAVITIAIGIRLAQPKPTKTPPAQVVSIRLTTEQATAFVAEPRPDSILQSPVEVTEIWGFPQQVPDHSKEQNE